jgi:Tol biopolymer transport system component
MRALPPRDRRTPALLVALVALACQGRQWAPATTEEVATHPVEVLRMPGVENAYPRWSPDGRRILFQSNRTGRWQLYVMDRDGSNERRLTDDGFDDNLPDLSPDGTRVAFVSNRNGDQDVWVMAMDGGGLRNLTRDPGFDIHPYWAPDGKSVLFNSNRRAADNYDVYRVSLDGEDLERLTDSDDEETCARLSPDGKRIVLLVGERTRDGNDEVYSLDSHGEQRRNLSRTPVAEGWPAWSPDGREIVYASRETGIFCLYLMDSEGGHRRRITAPEPPFWDARPQIAADGRSVVFNRSDGKTIAIYTLQLP